MLSTSILTRAAVLGLMLAGIVTLADVMARAQLAQAVEGFASDTTRTAVQVAGAVD